MSFPLTPGDRTKAVILPMHGTVESLDDLPGFVTNIRRGSPPPPELIAELRHRYQAIGGHSPLNTIAREVAVKVEARLGVMARMASRLWHPYVKDVLAELVDHGARTVAVVPLAQHSAAIYGASVREAAEAIASAGGPVVRVVAADNWGQTPSLLDAFAGELLGALERVPADAWASTTVLTTAHSLPVAVIRGGDAYEDEVRKSAAAVVALAARKAGRPLPKHEVVFQSQGMSAGPGGRPMEWLGPRLEAALDAAKERGDTHVVLAPIGFLADHVEVLYDLDVEAAGWAEARGLLLSRTASLNAGEALVQAVCDVARPLLSAPGGGGESDPR